MKFSSSAANGRVDPLNMDIIEVQTNITASKSGFETSQFLKRGQPLRSHVWGSHDDFGLLCHLKFQMKFSILGAYSILPQAPALINKPFIFAK